VKLLAFSLAALALGAPAAQARLGDSEAELIQRFGDEEVRPPFFTGARHLVFVKQGFVIDVGLIDGISEMELYSLDHAQHYTVLEAGKVRALLSLESQGHPWTPVVTENNDKWTRGDGAVAYFSQRDQTFSVESGIYRDKERDYRQSQQPSIEGF
jgi:hypothetical protein